MTVKKEDLEQRLTYMLKKPHTHNGIDYTQDDVDEGVEIELDDGQAQVLLDQGIIEAGQQVPEDLEKPESD
jgi:hypothetical protein